MAGSSAGLLFRNAGGVGIPGGSRGMAAAIADCKSDAALSMSRLRSNCKVMLVVPAVLEEVIESTPAMVVNCRSSTVATEDAIVAGSPPGRLAVTLIVGYAIVGNSLIGS